MNIILFFLGLAATFFLSHSSFSPVFAQNSDFSNYAISSELTFAVAQPEILEQKGINLYEKGKFAEALAVWQQAIQIYQNQGDSFNQARLLSHICLAYQQLGEWKQAENAIAQSLNLLPAGTPTTPEHIRTLAQILNTKGIFQFTRGQAENALETWQKAAQAYEQIKDEIGIIRAQINQSQALQSLGFYQRTLTILTQVKQALETQPDSQLKVVGLRSLGDILRLKSDLDQSQQVLEETLAIARKLKNTEEIGATLLSLGKTAQAKGDYSTALAYYQQAVDTSTSPLTSILSQQAQLNLNLTLKQWENAASLWPAIQSNINQLNPSHPTIYAQIAFARSLIRFQQSQTNQTLPDWMEIAKLLAHSRQQAQTIGDRRAEIHALGYLGQVYQQTQQWSIAQELTEQALILSQALNAPELSYNWQWQLGRILKAQNKRQQAIAAYLETTKILDNLSQDLVTVNEDIQFSFRDRIEPIYRELIELLLKPDSKGEVSQSNLAQSLEVMEGLQVAELNNFFREACLEPKPIQIGQIDPQAAAIYPIILGDRLEIILSLPNQSLYHYAIPITPKQLEAVVTEFRQTLVIRSGREFFAPGQQLYDWLIRPTLGDLANQHIKTLVFVPDGVLRNVPIAALYDGEQFLIEQYAVALAPGLQLLAPQPVEKLKLATLTAGISQEHQGFPALKYVVREIETIKAKLATFVLLNQEFTQENLAQEMKFSPTPIVHIATHGQFSSRFDETFLLAWDSTINIFELESLLQSSSFQTFKKIELLVLSACETATGDKRAALGLAGMAVRAGARATTATLWTVNDLGTAEFMSKFYQVLTKSKENKAEALRQAQLALLNTDYLRYKHPFYWAAYVLVGNWL